MNRKGTRAAHHVTSASMNRKGTRAAHHVTSASMNRKGTRAASGLPIRWRHHCVSFILTFTANNDEDEDFLNSFLLTYNKNDEVLLVAHSYA